MDTVNRFETPMTARIARAESLGLLLISLALLGLNLHRVDWILFIALFIVIDLFGYLPGAVAYRCSANGRIAVGYYIAYNVMHSYLTWITTLGLASAVVGWQWAFLAVPIHLLGDRGLFGNAVKSFHVSFEPEPLPAYVHLVDSLGSVPSRQIEVSGHGRG